MRHDTFFLENALAQFLSLICLLPCHNLLPSLGRALHPTLDGERDQYSLLLGALSTLDDCLTQESDIHQRVRVMGTIPSYIMSYCS